MAISKRQTDEWKEIVKQLEAIANQKNITQEEIADRTGMIQSAISRVFAAKFIPKLSTVFLIAEALGVEIKITEKSKM
jgi:transcriptional regulator with XRE-family HTH domain